uniref:Uncharacterized protein n=1 Tax=Alexandrium monilatum TaxID=311494 RepID=A0A7S4T633_9DINO
MNPAALALSLAAVLLAAAWAGAEAEKTCRAALEPPAAREGGVSMLQIVKRVGRAASEAPQHDTHLDPYNVSEGEVDRPRYAEDWRTEWKPDPNPRNRTTATTTEMPTPPRSSAPCASGAGVVAAAVLSLALRSA